MIASESTDLESFQNQVLQEIGELQRLSGPHLGPSRQGCFIDTLFPILGAISGAVIGYNKGIQSNIVNGFLIGVIGIIIGGLIGFFVVGLFYALTDFVFDLPELPKRYKRKKSQRVAKRLIKRKDIRKHLCPALQSVSNDVWELAKTATPILFTLATAGTISIPRDPIVFAALSLVIARMGVASLCADLAKK